MSEVFNLLLKPIMIRGEVISALFSKNTCATVNPLSPIAKVRKGNEEIS